MTVLLLSVANGYDSCRISIPGYVVDPAAYDVILTFGGSFASAVPYTDCTRNIAACNVVAGRREPSDCCCRGVAGVLGAYGRLVNESKENGFVVLQ